MVSPLSSRIFNLEAKAKVKNCTVTHLKANTKLPWHIESRRKRISGYTADADGESLSQDVHAAKQLRAHQIEASAKKRKVDEANFQVHNVKNDLIKAGIEYSPRSRALPHGTIDMSNVELVMASKYKPDTTPYCTSTPYEMMSAYTSLIDASRMHYKGGHKRRRGPQKVCSAVAPSITSMTTGASSSASSPFDSDSEEGNASPTYTLSGLVEKVKEYKTCSALTSPKTKLITLHNALKSSGCARLILKAQAPYDIVHSSAAFSQLSGIRSDLLMGSALSRFLVAHDDKTVDLILSEASKKKGSKVEAEGLKKVMTCTFEVFQVVGSKYLDSNCENKKPPVTHYVLDVQELPSSTQKTVNSFAEAVSKKILNEAATVIG